MGKAEFQTQLEACGYKVRELFPNFLAIDFKIDTGRLAGTAVALGFFVPTDFPDLPPGGPNFNPHLLPLNSVPNTPHPLGGIHLSKILYQDPEIVGAEWQYWSRPFTGWANTDRSVETYLAHIRHLLDTL
jgi:hypothetical protein